MAVSKPTLRVFASSSFIAQWGPGPIIKSEFEKQCNCVVEFYDNADSVITIQRLKSGSVADSVDVVLGLDQYDLEMATQGVEWRRLAIDPLNFISEVRPMLNISPLIPYNWSYLTFLVRKSEVSTIPQKLDDFLSETWRASLALHDPRTSSPGLQFLMWLIHLKGEEEAFNFLKRLSPNVHSYSPSWSSAYGLFQKGQAKSVFSYATSQIYHEVEDKSQDYDAIRLEDGHPIQFEFVGVPASCGRCDIAENFVRFLLGASAQKIVMEKNYMMPVTIGVAKGTAFSKLPEYKLVSSAVLPTQQDRERILKKWSALRRGE